MEWALRNACARPLYFWDIGLIDCIYWASGVFLLSTMSLRLRCSNGVSACYRRRDAVAIKRLSESMRQREKRPQCGRRGLACGVRKAIYSDLNTESPVANANGAAVPLPVTRLARFGRTPVAA